MSQEYTYTCKTCKCHWELGRISPEENEIYIQLKKEHEDKGHDAFWWTDVGTYFSGDDLVTDTMKSNPVVLANCKDWDTLYPLEDQQ